MVRSSLIFVLVLCVAWSGSQSAAQILTDEDMAALDLSAIDTAINNIALQVERLKGDASVASPPLAGVPGNSTDPTPAVAVQTTRSRANALCFRDSETGHVNPAKLDTYFDDFEGLVKEINVTLAAFEGLKVSFEESACPSFMTDMVTTIDGQLASISRRDLSDLVFHLESCWPDDDMSEADQTPVTPAEMDKRFLRARTGLNAYGRIQRSYREASQWCE